MQQQKKAVLRASELASPRHSVASDASRPHVPAIVRTSRGLSYNVQQAYANWQRGMGRIPRVR